MKLAQDGCYDLGIDIVREYGWKEPENLENLFYLMQEKAVIDSDLVNQMIAMYRLRRELIEEKIEQGDYKLVHEILMQNIEDMNLFIKQIGEFVSIADSEEKKYQII